MTTTDVQAAAEAIMKAAGTSLRHYMPSTKTAILEATAAALRQTAPEPQAGDDGVDEPPEGLGRLADMLTTHARECFPSSANGQVHFARAIMESVASDLRKHQSRASRVMSGGDEHDREREGKDALLAGADRDDGQLRRQGADAVGGDGSAEQRTNGVSGAEPLADVLATAVAAAGVAQGRGRLAAPFSTPDAGQSDRMREDDWPLHRREDIAGRLECGITCFITEQNLTPDGRDVAAVLVGDGLASAP